VQEFIEVLEDSYIIMKKLLLSLLLFVWSILSFWSCYYEDIVYKPSDLCWKSYCTYVWINVPATATWLEFLNTNVTSTAYCFWTRYNSSNIPVNVVLSVDYRACYFESLYTTITVRFYMPEPESCPVIDQEYCLGNNLCPEFDTWDCAELSWDNWSALYINDIQHESAWVINVNIPWEIDWDYTNEDNEFNLDVIWYNVDTDYIEDIIGIQTTKPNKTDLNNIITWILPLFVPWLVIILFVYFVFKLIKKLF